MRFYKYIVMRIIWQLSLITDQGVTMGKWKYHLALQCCALLYGSTALVGKLFSASMTTLVFGRGVLAIILLVFFLRYVKREPIFNVSRKKFGQLFFMGCLLGVHWWTFFVGVQLGGVAVGTLGFASFPAFVVILEMLFYKGKASWREAFVLIMVTIGLVMITPDFDLRAEGTIGLIWGIISGLLYSFVIVLNRQWAMDVEVIRCTLIQFIGLTVLFLPVGISGMWHLSVYDIWALLFMGIFCTGIAYTFYIYGMRGTSARVASVTIALEPVYAIIMASVYFVTLPDGWIIAGACLIICAVVLSSLSNSKKTDKKHEDKTTITAV